MTGVSLIMATLGRVEEVRRFIEHLALQTYKTFELIVVDQNSDDRLLAVLNSPSSNGMTIRHIRQAEPNQCLARNRGLSQATMDIVAFPDDDCWYEPQTLERVVLALTSPGAAAGVVIRWFEQDPKGSPARLLENSKMRDFREVDASMITQFFQRQIFDKVGAFEPALGLHSWFGGAEETDLMFRVLSCDLAIAYLPDALVHHVYHQAQLTGSLKAVCRQARSRARGTGALYAKHNLSESTIARGFLAPIFRPLITFQGARYFAQGIFISVGRVEGFVRWKTSRTGR